MQKMKERLDALSDAIVAIAMTILVLEIKAPTNSEAVPEFIRHIGLFAVSFIVIFNFWYERTQNNIEAKKTNDEIISLDLLCHLLVCLVPLASKFMMDFENQHIAVLVYGVLTTLISLTSDLIRIRLVRYRMIKLPDDINDKVMVAMIRFARRSLYVRIVILIFAYFYPSVGIYTYLIMPIFMVWSRYRAGKAHARRRDGDNTTMDLFIQMAQGKDIRPKREKHRTKKVNQ